jgi:hypothetical protein
MVRAILPHPVYFGVAGINRGDPAGLAGFLLRDGIYVEAAEVLGISGHPGATT